MHLLVVKQEVQVQPEQPAQVEESLAQLQLVLVLLEVV